MVILHVYIHVKPEHLDEFIAATLVNAENSRKEPGVARFDIIRQEDDPTRFVLCEVYRNTAAVDRHRETAHYNEWVGKAPAWMVEPRTRTRYVSVSPADQGW